MRHAARHTGLTNIEICHPTDLGGDVPLASKSFDYVSVPLLKMRCMQEARTCGDASSESAELTDVSLTAQPSLSSERNTLLVLMMMHTYWLPGRHWQWTSRTHARLRESTSCRNGSKLTLTFQNLCNSFVLFWPDLLIHLTRASSTNEGEDSLCSTIFINDIEDFCLWGAAEPDSIVGDIE